MNRGEALWRIIYIAHSEAQAQRALHLLESEGFYVRRRAPEKSAARADGLIELRVLESEAFEARTVLMENGL